MCLVGVLKKKLLILAIPLLGLGRYHEPGGGMSTFTVFVIRVLSTREFTKAVLPPGSVKASWDRGDKVPVKPRHAGAVLLFGKTECLRTEKV